MYRISRTSRHIRKCLIQPTYWATHRKNKTSGATKEAVLSTSERAPTKKQSETSTATTSQSEIISHGEDLECPTGLPQIPEHPSQSLRYAEPETVAVLDVARQREEMLRMASPFDEMPGPPVLKYLARGWSYLPQISNQFTAAAMVYFMNMLGRIDDHSEGGATLMWNRAVAPFVHMFDKYGPVVRLQGIFGGDIVFVARPEHIEAVYKEEGKYPIRSALDSLEKYRMERRGQGVAGPFILFGPEWETIRKKMEAPLMKAVGLFAPQLEIIADEFIENLKSLLNRQEEVPANFDREIFKWAFESVALVTLGKRMNCVGPKKLLPGSVGFSMLEAVEKASRALRQCESGFQMWRLVTTPSWRNMVNSCEVIDSIVMKFVRETENRLQAERLGIGAEDDEDLSDVQTGKRRKGPSPHPVPLVEALLLDGETAEEDVLTVALDVLLLGSSATAHALSFLLYRMAKSPRSQRHLFDELSTAMPEAHTRLARLYSKTGVESIDQLTFLKACLRESLRMNPPIPVLTRILPKDIALHNYRVPRGTVVLMASHVAGMKDENFDDAKKFVPERWLKLDKDFHPFAALPYGHGPRSCVARHLADIQILMVAAKVFRNFSVEYNYGTMHPSNGLIAMPNKPLKFRFIDRI